MQQHDPTASFFPSPFVLLFLFFLGFIASLGFRLAYVRYLANKPFVPISSSFTLAPPTHALRGTLVTITGTVEKMPRDTDEFEMVTDSTSFLQGETIATRDLSSAEITIGNAFAMTLSPQTTAGLVNLVPTSLVIKQSQGSITYTLIDKTHPLAVRSLHLLTTILSGRARIDIQNERITVTVLTGQAKIAMVDHNNDTHVWTIEEGQRAVVDDPSRTVRIR